MGGLDQYRHQLKEWFSGVDNFVETGCYKGEGLSEAAPHCKKLYSCDLFDKWINISSKRVPEAIIVRQPSTLFLTMLLPSLAGHTFFWLDAHFPKQYGKGEVNSYPVFPLPTELALIRSLKKDFQHDVILCDDIRVIQSNDNPVRCAIGQHHVRKEHLIYNLSLAEIVEPFNTTHTYEFVGLDALLFLPRSRQ